MSHFGYADFDRPTKFIAGTIFYPFGGGPFSLAPYRCSVANLEDGRVNFLLDLIRPSSPLFNDAHAILEMRLNADYASDKALAFLRTNHPQAVLSPCVLTNWEFRLASSPVTLNVPCELLSSTQLASNNLGSARMVMRLSIESGLMMESLLRDTNTPVYAVAEAQIMGVSPRVGAVARFKTSELMPALFDMTSDDHIISWQSIVNFFSRDVNGLPIVVSGSIDPDRTIAFGEAMADRIIARFGSYVTSDSDISDPLIKLCPMDDLEEINLIWSLSQPFLASRHILLHFDFLSDVRQRIQSLGIDAFVRRHTAAALPSFGQSNVMVFCNLPTERVGVAALGATLSFPPKPPNRPHAKNITVLFEPPEDIVQTQIKLAPGESLHYDYSTFVVISDEHGVREIKGPEISHVGSPLRLSPRDFPIDFVLIEISKDLATIALITGVCRYEHDGQEYMIPFELDSGRLSASLALPKDSDSVNVQCTASSRGGNEELSVGPFESPYIRLDLSSFAEYGWHEVEFECIFNGDASIFAIDVLPVGLEETFANMTILAFTPDQPRRRFGWFAYSPFRPGFRYRPHGDNDARSFWQDVSTPSERFVVYQEQPGTTVESKVVAVSENVMRQPAFVGVKPTSETSQIIVEQSMVGVPISPQSETTDLLLYSHPADPAKKLYVPRYGLDVQTVSGQQQYRISMTQKGASVALTIHLVVGPAESLREAARTAEEYPHEFTISLTFLQSPPSGARKILTFQEITRNGAIVTASMTFATLQERDEVFRALTETNRDARLIVKRLIDVMIPQASPSKITRLLVSAIRPDASLPPRPITASLQPTLWSSSLLTARIQPASPELSLLPGRLQPILRPTIPPITTGRPRPFPSTGFPIITRPHAGTPIITRPPVSSLPTPVLSFVGKEITSTRSNRFTQAKLSITNWEKFSSDFFKPSPDLPPCGKNKKASRTWVDIHDAKTDARLYGFCAISSPKTLTKLWFSVPSHKNLPDRVYVKFNDRRAKVVRKSNVVETKKPEPIPPLYRQVRKELDCIVKPELFAFLKDLHGYMFKGIVPGSESNGLVRFRLPWRGIHHTYLQDATRPHVVYFFPDQFKIARRQEAPFTPFITVRVVSNAGSADTDVVFDYIVAPHTEPRRLREAREALMADPTFSATDVQFQPFVTSDVRFFIDRPTQQGTVRKERTGASLVLQGFLKDTLVMKLPDFGIIFDAMHRDTASLFLGRIEIEVPGENSEVIPFTARMDDLAGELFLYTADANSDGSINVSLMNAIESPIQIDALDASVSSGGHFSNASIQGLAFPVENLDPGSTVQMTVMPATPLTGSGTPEVNFSLEAVQVISDPEAIWDTILDGSTLEYFDIITVKAIPTLFEPIPGRENDQILVILVDFESGGTIELTKNNLEDEVRIDYPIDDVILRQSIDTSYRYTITVIRVDRQKRDAEPRQRSDRTFFVNVQR